MSAGLYGSVGGVNRKIKKLYANVGGVNREIKELWAVKDGVNRKIYSAGIEGILGAEFFKKVGENLDNLYNIHAIQNDTWQAGLGTTGEAYTTDVYAGGYLILHIPDDAVAPLKLEISSHSISFHSENQTQQHYIDLELFVYNSSQQELDSDRRWILNQQEWICTNTFPAYSIAPLTINTIPTDRILLLRMCVSDAYYGTSIWDANSKHYLQLLSGGLTVNNIPVVF